MFYTKKGHLFFRKGHPFWHEGHVLSATPPLNYSLYTFQGMEAQQKPEGLKRVQAGVPLDLWSLATEGTQEPLQRGSGNLSPEGAAEYSVEGLSPLQG